MRPTFLSLTLAAFFLVACSADTPEPYPLPVSVTAANTQTPVHPTPGSFPRRAPVLRIATLGETHTTNVWALFSEAGADYWSLATQISYWPSLYRLVPPSFDLQPAMAKGRSAQALCDPAGCTATVTLQPGLTWTDGSAFTAADVAFTINTALQFKLGMNWERAYNPDVLDRAEPLDEFTVKFYFKSKPTIADWQYGALQGPIVNRSFWQPRIGEALNLLSEGSLQTTIQELEAELARIQADLNGNEISQTSTLPESTPSVITTNQANRLQDDITSIQSRLENSRAEYEIKLSEARASLLSIVSVGEPTLGPWKFADQTAESFENQAHLGTPMGDPWFDGIHYVTYPNESEAVAALLKNEVDIVLTPDGLSSDAVSRLKNNSEILLWRNVTHSVRFLAFNHANPDLADPFLHRALACMLEPQALIESLGSNAAPLSGFVVDDFWRQGEASLPCTGVTGDVRLTEAIRQLKVAGYSWEREPTLAESGVGLKSPAGKVLPTFVLVTLDQDLLRTRAAGYVARQAEILGLSVDIQMGNPDELLYAVYSSGNYDLAILGWHLSAYPSYLCDWFMPLSQNSFAYNGSSSGLGGGERLGITCEMWSQADNLDKARAFALEVQSALMNDLPLIPLYSIARVDAFRNIRYPFAKLVDGLGGLYGAPGLAIPMR